MSEKPKGGTHTTKRGEVKFSVKHNNLLITQAERHGLTKKKIIEILIMENEEHGIVEEGWERKVNKKKGEADISPHISRLKPDDCPALADTWKDGFVCCLKAPSQKKLGDGNSGDKKQVCGACIRIKGIIEERDLLREQVKAGIVVDIPSCIHGGQVSDDGKKLYCKNSNMEARYRSVKNWCKVLKKGANCDGLRWTRVEAKGKFAEPEK